MLLFVVVVYLPLPNNMIWWHWFFGVGCNRKDGYVSVWPARLAAPLAPWGLSYLARQPYDKEDSKLPHFVSSTEPLINTPVSIFVL
jgi:hypothetical protein